MTRTTEQAIEETKKMAQQINELAAAERWPVGLSVASGLMFAAGTAGLNGVISRADFLELAAYNYDQAQQHRRKRAN